MSLIFQTSPTVRLATNIFVDVPTVLQFDDTPLISVVREQNLGFTTEVPIFHSDGTYLAKVNGTRIFPTEAGAKAGIVMRSLPQLTVCEMAGKTLFEVHHEKGAAFRIQAELSTPTGYFVKLADAPKPIVMKSDGNALNVGGLAMSGSFIQGCRIGIWIRSDGSVAMGCN